MRGGISNSVGIVFYDTEKSGENAVFCFFEEGRPAFRTGERKTLMEESKEMEKKRSALNKSAENKILLAVFLSLIVFIVAVWIFIGGFFPVFGAVLFSVVSFFPILVLAFSANRIYPDDVDFHQFRRFHGAEHMLIEYSGRKNPTWEPDDIRKTSFYHRECGTVYSAEGIIFGAVLGLSFAFLPKIGILWFFGIIFLSLILLFLNLFNPYNPLMLFQRFAVEEPGEKEILLAAEGIKILNGIE